MYLLSVFVDLQQYYYSYHKFVQKQSVSHWRRLCAVSNEIWQWRTQQKRSIIGTLLHVCSEFDASMRCSVKYKHEIRLDVAKGSHSLHQLCLDAGPQTCSYPQLRLSEKTLSESTGLFAMLSFYTALLGQLQEEMLHLSFFKCFLLCRV